MAHDAVILLPGEVVNPSLLPPTKKGVLTLGPGLRHVMPTDIYATTAGSLNKNDRKGATWLEFSSGRYTPTVGDLVVAQIHHSATDVYYCMLAPHTANVILGHLNFEGASRKTRPQLKAGDLVYARVSRATKGEDVEIECVNSSTGKADGLGPLKAGMDFSVSLAYARKLMSPGESEATAMLQEFGEKINFEIAIGRNGVIWLQSPDIQTILMIGNKLKAADQWAAASQAATGDSPIIKRIDMKGAPPAAAHDPGQVAGHYSIQRQVDQNTMTKHASWLNDLGD